MIKDGGDKISADSKKELERAIAEAKENAKAEDLDKLKASIERLQNASHKVATEMYQQGGDPNAAGPGTEGTEGTEGPESSKKKADDDVVDADYKEV